MGRAIGWLMRVFGWMVALVVALVIVVSLMRSFALDTADRAAIALMNVPPPAVDGRNGFAALMLSDIDIADDRRDAALADDIAAFGHWEDEHADDVSLWSPTRVVGSPAEAPFEPFAGLPRRGGSLEPDQLCPLSGTGCLALVRRDPVGTRALLESQEGKIAAVEEALAADHILNAYPLTMSTPLPPLQNLRLPLAVAALDAVEGRTPSAYARTCRLLVAARRLDRDSRDLVGKFVAQTLARGAAALLLDLRRESPTDALPADCAQMRAPIGVAESSVCEAMRGEFRIHRAFGEQLQRQLRGWQPERWMTRALLVDVRLQSAAIARTLAPYCTDEAREDAASGLSTTAPAFEPGRLACWSAYVSCLLNGIALPAFDNYADRALDHAAMLRLLLAAQDVADGRATPDDAAAGASVAGYPVDFDPAAQRATIMLRAPLDPDSTRFQVDFAGLAPSARPREQPRDRDRDRNRETDDEPTTLSV